MFYDYIREQAEATPRAALPAVTAALWRAYAEGKVTETEAGKLSDVIQARRVGSPDRGDQLTASGAETPCERAGRPRSRVGSRPRSDASLERRRRWAASGRLPPALAARFTLAEQAVLSLVAAETARRGDCRLAVGHLAAIVGVAETTVRNAIREARKLGLVTVEERQITGFRNDTNVVRIVSPEWTAWLRLARKPEQNVLRLAVGGHNAIKGGGCKSPKGTSTEVQLREKSRSAEPLKGLPTSGGRPHSVRAGSNPRGR